MSDRRIAFISTADVEPVCVKWLWTDRIPVGAVTLLVGDPGRGKSTLSIELAARVSHGQLEGDLQGAPGRVLMANAEDAIAQVVVPRLVAADADRDRVEVVQILTEDDATEGLRLPDDLPDLERKLVASDVKLLVIDPLVAHLNTGINGHRDQDVRTALAPLAGLAERCDLAVLAVMHLNKGVDPNAIYRVGGSIGFAGTARSVLVFGNDPEDAEGPTRIVAHAKSNFGPHAPALRVKLENGAIETAAGAFRMSHIVWCGDAAGITADSLLVRRPAEERSAVETATDALRTILSLGAVPVEDVDKELRGLRISKRTAERARQQLGLRPQKAKGIFNGKWYLELPPEGRHTLNGGGLRETGAQNGTQPREIREDRQGRQGGLAVFEGRQPGDVLVEVHS